MKRSLPLNGQCTYLVRHLRTKSRASGEKSSLSCGTATEPLPMAKMAVMRGMSDLERKTFETILSYVLKRVWGAPCTDVWLPKVNGDHPRFSKRVHSFTGLFIFLFLLQVFNYLNSLNLRVRYQLTKPLDCSKLRNAILVHTVDSFSRYRFRYRVLILVSRVCSPEKNRDFLWRLQINRPSKFIQRIFWPRFRVHLLRHSCVVFDVLGFLWTEFSIWLHSTKKGMQMLSRVIKSGFSRRDLDLPTIKQGNQILHRTIDSGLCQYVISVWKTSGVHIKLMISATDNYYHRRRTHS